MIAVPSFSLAQYSEALFSGIICTINCDVHMYILEDATDPKTVETVAI